MSGILLALVLVAGAQAAPGSEEQDARASTSRHFVTGGRNGDVPSAVSRDEYGPLAGEGLREKPGASQGTAGKTGGQTLQSTTHDFWIFYADVILFGDDDRDGYHYGVDLLFDADTIYEVADVYAVLYLSFEGGPWNEYAVTEDFSIFGATSDDEFVVVTELESGYPRGSYDILIELYDAFDGTFLASLGPADTSELGYLPLEDFGRDDPHVGGGDHHHHGGGSLGMPLLALLALFVAVTRLRRRPGAVGARIARDAPITGRITVRAPGCDRGLAPGARSHAGGARAYRAAFGIGGGAASRAVRMTLRLQAASESK